MVEYVRYGIDVIRAASRTHCTLHLKDAEGYPGPGWRLKTFRSNAGAEWKHCRKLKSKWSSTQHEGINDMFGGCVRQPPEHMSIRSSRLNLIGTISTGTMAPQTLSGFSGANRSGSGCVPANIIYPSISGDLATA